MEITTNIIGEGVRTSLAGSMYVEDAAILREELIKLMEAGYSRFVIDLRKVDYIDSSGLGVLVAIQKRARQKNGGVIIAGATGMVKEVFELTRLTKVFEMQ